MLLHPSFDRTFVLHTDASCHAPAVVDDGALHPVVYGSHMSKAEANYGIMDLEALSLV